MPEKKETMHIADAVRDPVIREDLYLGLSIEELIDKMRNLTLKEIGNDQLVPFWAKTRGYKAGCDPDGRAWLVKEIPNEQGPAHKIQEVAYYIDFLLKTPAAPTIVLRQDGITFRATKQISNAMQIGSYNYLQEPFIKMLANDLLNRWLFFDEDRNPNNYLVKHDLNGEPFLIVIDYNKADLETLEMKVVGSQERFGWHRQEKTRFLTLLKPENFKGLSVDDFDGRLSLMTGLGEARIMNLCLELFSCGMFNDPVPVARRITSNLLRRIEYLDRYFRTWFRERNMDEEKEGDDRYAGLGQSFVEYYKRRT